jgi:predicted amino acid racemase
LAYIELNSRALKHNFNYLNNRFIKYEKDWGVVSKILCGNDLFLQELIKLNPSEIHDSRLSNLEKIQKIAPHIQRVYIKPPPLNSIKRLVACADVSFNTHITTIKSINEEAIRQKKVHKIIIMIELGDLREGVIGENLIEFYKSVFELKNIDVIGLGANLNCLNGILPTKDKLIQLSLYKELINAKFNSKIAWVSAGSSITLPLLSKKQVPKGCNHFRIGETLYFGNNLYTNKGIKAMRQDVFRLKAEVIEIKEKPMVAVGMQGTNLLGEQPEFNIDDLGEESIRAIIDVGTLDVRSEDIVSVDKSITILGSSSDMLVLDLGNNPQNIKLGDELVFKPNYTGLLALMNSNYIEKKIV